MTVEGGPDCQVIRDFQRFLEIAGTPPRRGPWYLPSWRWVAYVNGQMGAPPLIWEGDNA